MASPSGTGGTAAECSECGHAKALHPFSDSGRHCTQGFCVCPGYNPPDPPVAVPGPASERPHRLRLLWNRLDAKLHHAYPCGKCGYAYNCPDGECHS